MNKKDIINFMKKYDFDPNKYSIISGAAMVLHGLKEETHDIDIYVTKDYFDYLLSHYDCVLENTSTNAYMIDDIINFGLGYKPYTIENIDGISVSSIDDIVLLKKNLNREKDRVDLRKIEEILNERNQNRKNI